MKVALINPNWNFAGSIYFGCREPHLPLELGYTKLLLERAGHEAAIFDAHLHDLPLNAVRNAVADFAPDATVVTTAPTYLFWRCAPPELRVPRAVLQRVADVAGVRIAVGPHGSTTPQTALRKLGVDVVVMGECEEIVPRLLAESWRDIPSICYAEDGDVRVQGGPHAGTFVDLPALSWPDDWIRCHRHHHHRFDIAPVDPGVEVEASRGCPYHCSFCAKENFRDKYRRRRLPILLEEIDRLVAQGAAYVYFIDEIFLPNRPLLEALVERPFKFGVQTRIDLWKHDMIELLGAAGCVSIEAGVESLTPEGRDVLDKDCRISTDELTERLIFAKQHVPFVQANLILSGTDDPREIARWRDMLRDHGVWANDPVPLFPYPGSPDYRKLWGLPDDAAWERALDHYLTRYASFSDIQERQPLPLHELETGAAPQ
ncbi:MAG TPA: TIGR04295 family B12-binding domain-containing radical SAM protein [Alphaproteobacteria bacterium]